jgi:hypothetical protein
VRPTHSMLLYCCTHMLLQQGQHIKLMQQNIANHQTRVYFESSFCSSGKGHEREKSEMGNDKHGKSIWTIRKGERKQSVLDTSVRFAPFLCFMALSVPILGSIHQLPIFARPYKISRATSYRMDDQEVAVRVPVRPRIFSSPSQDRFWGPPNLLSNTYRVLFPSW